MNIIKKTSPYHNERRAQVLVVHAMTVSQEEALKTLEGKSEYEVSCHYAIDQEGKLYQYMDETRRAWHAGLSFWHGFTDINSLSVGVELIAPQAEHNFDKVVFTDKQMQAFVDWAKDVIELHRIKPENILAHQDIAPGRKPDPGPNFPWAKLAEQGIGLWHDLNDEDTNDTFSLNEEDKQHCLALLKDYGYDLRNPTDEQVKNVVVAFQTHFLPGQISGTMTKATYKAIQSLMRQVS